MDFSGFFNFENAVDMGLFIGGIWVFIYIIALGMFRKHKRHITLAALVAIAFLITKYSNYVG